MQTRTKHFVAHFSAPFRLSGFDGVQPAGAYALDQQGPGAAGASSASYHCKAMFMHLPGISEGRWTLRLVRVDPAEVEAAILYDLEQDSGRMDAARGESKGR